MPSDATTVVVCRLDSGSPYEGATFTQHGRYVRITRRDHPLADKNGKVMVHRAVVYDAIGPGPHRCELCGMDGLDWFADRATDPNYLAVDHEDGDGTNNLRENLRPVHDWCNNNRPGIDRAKVPWSVFESVPIVEREPMWNTHTKAPTERAYALARAGAATPPEAKSGEGSSVPPRSPSPDSPALPPIRKGLVRWEDLVG